MTRRQLVFVIILLITTAPFFAQAQAPVASFTASKTAGCSPVVVQFTDNSTNSPTSWHWDLGNGGSSSLQNPAANYITPGTYTVILTATNANGSTKDTNYITVYAAPSVAFTANDTSTACGSKTVLFTNQTVPNAGGSTSYLWDFGDGDSSTVASPTHTYNTSGTYHVTLIAVNSNGCTKTLTKNNYITVAPTPTISFTANGTSGCNAPFSTTFTNNTTGGVSYLWLFGDGNNSTATNPSHTYTSTGSYNVSLIATGSNSCKDTFTRNSYINVGSVTANFTAGTACAGQGTQFTNTTNPGPGTYSIWNFGDGNGDTAANPTHIYASAGTYNVTLIELYNTCSDTVTKSVTVHSLPTANFVASDSLSCDTPFNVNFTNTSSGAVSYVWDLDGGTSTATNPSYSYTSFGEYTIQLVATNSNGCTDTFTKTNYIKAKFYSIHFTPFISKLCVGDTINYTAGYPYYFQPTLYSWDFDDGTTSSCGTCNPQPKAYSTPGTYDLQLIVAAGSCIDTVQRTMTVYARPTANFSGSPLTICPGASVSFTNSSSNANAYAWNFGDGSTDTATNPSHLYPSYGTYDVTLIASNDGCSDTLTKSGYVNVQLPEADFTSTYNCSNRLSYTFLDSSQGANTYSWDFGDGNTSSTSGTVSHIYSSAGTYVCTLSVYNTVTGCTHTQTDTLNVVALNAPNFVASDTNICLNDSVIFTRDTVSNDVTFAWHFSNGSGVFINNSQSTSVIYKYTDTGSHDVMLKITDDEGCTDSTLITDLIKVGGGVVDFMITDTNVCAESDVLFTDISTLSNFPAVWRFWDFDDNKDDSTALDTIYHSFNNPGVYDVTLTVTDSIGCKYTGFKQNYVYAHRPTAQFYTDDTLVCAGDTVDFQNNSGGTSFSSFWEFGDGDTLTKTTPGHVYSSNGIYTVKLTVTDRFGCKDSITKDSLVTVEQPTASFSMSDSTGACPPLTVYMTNSSSNSVSYNWTFGNGSISSNTNPSATYTYPGAYTVKLIATHAAGCKDSTTKTVTVNGPTGTLSYSPTAGCSPVTVNFTATSNNTSTYVWDMNNGYSQTTSSGTFSYTYNTPGRYLPTLVLSDGASCQVPIQPNDTITVDTMAIDFSFTSAGNLCDKDTIHFNDTIITTFTNVASRSWDFGDGSSSSAEDPSHYYTSSGTYQVSLVVVNTNGCSDTVTKTVTINGLPNVNINASADSICPGQLTGAQLTATGADTFLWSPATGLSCTTCASPNANPTATTTYIVTGTDTNGCVNYDTATVYLKPKPTITVSNDTTLCSNNVIQILASGANTYSWTPGTGLSCTNCANPFANPPSTDTFTVIGTNGSGCSDTDAIIIDVIPAPTVGVSSNAIICTGDSTLLVATGAVNYSWTPFSTLSCDTCDSTYAMPTSGLTYTVVGTAANGCKDTNTVSVGVNGLPTVDAGSDTSICIGASIQLQATGANNYTWTPTTSLSCTNCASPTTSTGNTITYYVVGSDGNGCKDEDSVTITVNPLPTVSAGNDKTICSGFSTTLNASGANTYAWTPATGLSCTNCPSPTAGPANTTNYIVTGTDTNSCVNTDTVIVNVNPQPTISAGNDTSICYRDTIQLQATGGISYTWSPSTGLSCTNCANPMAYPTSTATYTVIGTDANGCKDTNTVTITVNALPNIGAGSNREICIGDSIQLIATGGLTYNWTPATGLSCTFCTAPFAKPTTTTTYTILGSDTNGCKDTGSIQVKVNPLPTVSAGNDQQICIGFSTTLTATGATTYAWTPSTGLSCTNCASPTASPATTTTYVVTGTDGNSCVNKDTVVVTIYSQPTVTGGGDKTICLGDTALLIGTGATTYTWSPTGTLSCGTCDSTYAYPTTTTTYSVIGSDASGCKDTATVKVTVNALPNISAGSDKTICYNSNTTLTATGGTSYTWSPSTGLSCTNCANPTANPTTTTVYTVTGIDGNSCSNTDQVTVTVNPLPNVGAGNDASICLNDSTQLQATGASSYSWAPSTGLSCTNCANPKASPATTTTYVVTGTDANGCVNTDTIVVTVLPLPTVVAGNDTAICVGSSAQLSATGAATYSWSPTANLSCTNCANPVTSTLFTTSYIVTGTAANSCQDTDTLTVTVNQLPNIGAGANIDICNGDSIQLNATGGVSYTWSPSAGLSCTSCPNPMAYPSSTSTYIITGTDTNSCTDTGSITITVKPIPVITVTAGRYTFCEDDTTQLTATGAQTYVWTPAGLLNNAFIANPIANPTTGANTTFTVTGTNNGCSDTAQVVIRTFAKPNVSAGADIDICIGNSDTLIASGATTYNWSPTAGLSCATCDTLVANPSTTTTYTLTGVDGNGCSDTDKIIVVVNPLPNISAGNDTSICAGDSVFLRATGGASYSWAPPVGLSCTNCASPKATTQNSSTFSVVGTDVNGCINSDIVTVSAMQKGPHSYSDDTTICVGEEVSLTADGGTSYFWYAGAGISNANAQTITVAPESSSTYRVIIKQGICFEDTGSMTVSVAYPPSIDAGPDQTVSGGQSIKLETKTEGAQRFEWSPAEGLSCLDCATPTITPKRSTTYYVKAISAEGCTAEDDVTIHVTCGEEQVFVANTFTPNGDGRNDRFYPQGRGLDRAERFSVYNRWGELIYDVQNIPLNDPNYGWDGTYKNQPLKPDVFVYILKVICDTGEPINVKGDISLIR